MAAVPITSTPTAVCIESGLDIFGVCVHRVSPTKGASMYEYVCACMYMSMCYMSLTHTHTHPDCSRTRVNLRDGVVKCVTTIWKKRTRRQHVVSLLDLGGSCGLCRSLPHHYTRMGNHANVSSFVWSTKTT